MSKKRYYMDLKVGPLSEAEAGPELRNLCLEDYQELGELLWHADQGTFDDEGQPIEESIAELKETLLGRYGPFLKDCSFGLLSDNRIVAASVITFYPKENLPLVVFAMTHPSKKSQGLCQRLLRTSSDALWKAGYESCYLAVNEGNIPAVEAYKKVGFKIRS